MGVVEGPGQEVSERQRRPSGPPTVPPGRGTPGITVAHAWRIVGGLSRTTKMPCHSWGLPASACKTGAALVDLEGSICHGCYARNHNYRWARVRRANVQRLANAEHPDWPGAMELLVDWQAQRNEEPYFRWFDSGDLQSADMLERIVAVARATPYVHHWLPTREYALVGEYLGAAQPPENLVVRLSAPMVDGEPPDILGLPTSTVHSREAPRGYACPAYDCRPATCGPCRACWDPTVPNVSYRRH